MAQAGWYGAPGEPGLLRYWSGDEWTEHRQPAPVAVPAEIEARSQAPVPALVPTLQRAPDPYGRSAEGSTTQISGQQPHARESIDIGLSFDGIPLGGDGLTQLPDLHEMHTVFADKIREAQNGAASLPRPTALRGAVSGMVVGMILIVIGAALLPFFSGQQSAGAGEASVQGSVVSHIGAGTECSPDVQFTVDGHNYQARSGIGGSCAQDLIGESVTVIYSVADPAGTGRYEFGNPMEPFVVALPLLGVVVFLSGLATFFVRLFRRRSQFAH